MSARAEGYAANELAALVSPTWSESKTCSALDASLGTLAARREAGTLLGLVTSDGVRIYPVFQFARGEDGRIETRPDVVTVIQPLRHFDPWAVAVLLNTPAPELDGATPIEWERDGGSQEPLRDLAQIVAKEWASGGPPSR